MEKLLLIPACVLFLRILRPATFKECTQAEAWASLVGAGICVWFAFAG